MKTVTVNDLIQKNACNEQVELFRQFLGNKTEAGVSVQNLSKAKEFGLDVFWLEKLMSAEQKKAYDEAIAPAYKAYEEARAPAYKAYAEIIAQALKDYEEAIASALKTYNEAGIVAIVNIFNMKA